MSMKCPSKALTCLELSAHPVWHRSKDGPTCSGTVEGQATDDILLDTGMLQNNGAYRLSVAQFSIQHAAGGDSVCSW